MHAAYRGSMSEEQVQTRCETNAVSNRDCVRRISSCGNFGSTCNKALNRVPDTSHNALRRNGLKKKTTGESQRMLMRSSMTRLDPGQPGRLCPLLTLLMHCNR